MTPPRTGSEDLPRTLGELRASGHRDRSVKEEIRENLLAALAAGDDVWPGIFGFEDTVLPQLERALIAGHDFVLLGERGQGKTRLLRSLASLLDEWTPVIAGAELGEHPYSPITPESIRRSAEMGDELPVAWRHRSERYTEKLATPDTSVADLVGDIDPIKVAEGRTLGDPETIAFGLIPRAHRGIVAVNELPDLAERIQVSMLNVMEERDIQVRGYTLRLPLDVLVVASANPEDYTNRGRIITPLKDRFGAEIRTHYPRELDAEVGVISQEAHLTAAVPAYLLQIVARFARLLRSLANLLDEWTPVIAGAELGEHPYTPITPESIRRSAEMGDELPVAWRHRSERYTEKLATPDTSVADLVGDIDPIKVAEGRTLGDPETIAYGLIPRAHRGIVAVNELPDLAERIQVSMLNVMEERDIQVRGYTLRLPLDVLVVASANPEDYTNRGRIITPLKDRFGAEIRTHYPLEVSDEVTLLRQEAAMPAVVPQHLLEVVARFTRQVRESPAVDQRSGVSARFAVACAESLSGAALRRAAIRGESDPVARIGDLPGIVPTLRGKVEFDVSEEGREEEILQTLARRAAAETFRFRLGSSEMKDVMNALAAWFDEGNAVETGDIVTAADVLAGIGEVDGLGRLVSALEGSAGESPGVAAACLEFALEGLWLTRRIDKDDADGTITYGIAPV